MAQKSNVFKQSIKQKGYWNYNDLYIFCFDWLKDNGYHVAESEYTEKLSGFGKEILITWAGAKKVSDYFKNTISVKWHILGMNDAEVEQDGVKIKTNKGEVKVVVSADLVRDYEEKWENKPLWKFLRGIYDKYIIRTTIDEYEGRLESDAQEYVDQIKSFLLLKK